MFTRAECRYHAPCGLCTYYNKPCDEVCHPSNSRHPKEAEETLGEIVNEPPDDVFKAVDSHMSLGTCKVFRNPMEAVKIPDISKYSYKSKHK